MSDLISIITPTYNCGKFIGETIESVINQTYENWEMIIVDDCSKDNTKDIVNAYGLKYLCCDAPAGVDDVVAELMNSCGPTVLEVFVDEDQEVCPRLKSVAREDGSFESPEYGNLYPFLDEELLGQELNLK